jgi:hypothetical protein
MQFAPVNVTSLFLDCPYMYSAEEVHALLKCVADGCQMLKALSLELISMEDLPNTDSVRKDRITFETLQPLVRLNLT